MTGDDIALPEERLDLDQIAVCLLCSRDPFVERLKLS